MADETTDQGQGQSVDTRPVLDRIYDKFDAETPEQHLAKVDNPDPEPSEEADQPDAEPEFEEVEYEGGRYQVPKALAPALMKNADYTQKTQELARQREVYEQSMSTVQLMNMENEFHQSVAPEKARLDNIDNYIRSLKSANFADMSTDDMVRNMHEIQRISGEREELAKALESRHVEFKSKFKDAIKDAKAKTHDLLSKQISGYSPKVFEGVREYAKGQGFTENVLDSIETDPKASAVLYKAMRFDQLQAGKVAAVKKLDAPVIKPGASKPMPQEVKDKLNFKKALASAKTRDERNAIHQKMVESMF